MNDWIPHRATKCPVPFGTLVDVRYRDGLEERGLTTGELRDDMLRDASCRFWLPEGQMNDIVAYRLHETTEQRIDRIGRELAELKERQRPGKPEPEKWKPDLRISVSSKYRSGGNIGKIDYVYESIRPAARVAEYVHEHAPDWDGSDPYTVWYDSDNQCYGTIDAYEPDIGTVTGPEWVMQKLADDLNSGRAEL